VDGPPEVAGGQGSVGGDPGAVAPALIGEHGARRQKTALDHPAEGNARLASLLGSGDKGQVRRAVHRREAPLGQSDVVGARSMPM